jgi:hypothetical protein
LARRDHRRPERPGRRGGQRSEATYNDADAVLHEAVMIQEHLLAQDKVLESPCQQGRRAPGIGHSASWTTH